VPQATSRRDGAGAAYALLTMAMSMFQVFRGRPARTQRAVGTPA